MKPNYPSIFNNLELKKELDRLHDQFVLVSADKVETTLSLLVRLIIYIVV